MITAVIITVRLALTLALFWWVWRDVSSPALLVCLALLTVRAEAGAALHLRHTARIEAMSAQVLEIVKSTNAAFSRVTSRLEEHHESWTRALLARMRHESPH